MSNPISNDIDSHIGKKYEIRRRLGKGAYGVVWKAIDREAAFQLYSIYFHVYSTKPIPQPFII